jgi:hypothetical protein
MKKIQIPPAPETLMTVLVAAVVVLAFVIVVV